MFGQLVFVRLRAAQKALRDGRLDEAHRLATAPDLRKHPRAATVLVGLTERFLERARTHFRADRFVEALADLDRAEAGDVRQDEIAELRSNVTTVAAEVERMQASRHGRVQDAKRRIEGGSLAAGRKLLEQASEADHAARRLKRKAANRVGEVMDIVEQVERLIEQGQHAAAARRIQRARSLDAHDERISEIETRLCRKVLDAVRTALMAGRLGRASDELGCLGDLGASLPAKRELMELLATAAEAARSVACGKYGDARRWAMSLARLLPDTPWIEQAIEQMRQIDDIRTALTAGPLGERIATPAGAPDLRQGGSAPSPAPPARLDETVGIPGRSREMGALPERLLLLVDGGGSYLLLRGDRVSIGRAACDDPPPVAILSDLAPRHADLARVDDDYFLFSGRDVEVAGRKTRHHLLRDGDRVLLGKKAKFTFRLLSRRSSTAVLDLSDTTKMPNDVRRVILLDHHATIGQGEHAHVRCRHAGTPLILFERGGAIWIRAKNDGHVDTEAVRLPLGEPVEVHGVGLVLAPWKVGKVGGTKV